MAAFGVLAATAQTASVNRATLAALAAYLGVIAMNVLATSGIVWFPHGIETAHDQRKRTLRGSTAGCSGCLSRAGGHPFGIWPG